MTAVPERASDLEALARGIELVSGTAFYFLVVNDPRERDVAIARLEAHLRRRRVQRVAIRRASESFLRIVRTVRFNGTREVLVVTGIENVLDDGAPFLRSLNASRDALAHALNGPVLFVLSSDALVAVMNEAPDFFSTRSGTFFLDDADLRQSRETRTVPRSARVDMSPAEVRARILEAEELLADWQDASEHTVDRYLRPARRLVDLLITAYDIDRAEEIARRAFELARDARPADAVSFALTLSQIARLRGDLAEARRYACMVREMAERSGDRVSLMRAHWLAAESAATPEEQEQDFRRALALAEVIADRGSAAQIKASLGIHRVARGAFADGLTWLNAARADAESAGDRPLIAEISSTMVSALLGLGRFSEAEEAALVSLREFQRLGDEVQASMAYIELGDVYAAQHRLDEAENAFRRSLELTRRSPVLPSRAIPPLLRLINIDVEKNDLSSAERLISEALHLLETFRDELPDPKQVEEQLRSLLDRIHAATR